MKRRPSRHAKRVSGQKKKTRRNSPPPPYWGFLNGRTLMVVLDGLTLEVTSYLVRRGGVFMILAFQGAAGDLSQESVVGPTGCWSDVTGVILGREKGS